MHVLCYPFCESYTEKRSLLHFIWHDVCFISFCQESSQRADVKQRKFHRQADKIQKIE